MCHVFLTSDGGFGNHGGRRSIRSIGRSRDRIDRFDRFDRFDKFSDFLSRRGARDLRCLVSKLQLCTTLGGRKNVEKPKSEFSEFFGSVGSEFR